MRKALALTLFVVLALPAMSLAGGWVDGHRHRYPRKYYTYPKARKIYRYSSNGGAIAAGVLGGILTGVILNRILAPSAQSDPVSHDHHDTRGTPVPRRHGDPYYEGYQYGYEQGSELLITNKYSDILH